MWLVLAIVVLQTPHVAAIQVHGNLVTSDEEIQRLADVQIGAPVDDDTADQMAARLRATKRFASVQVLKRYASIEDPTQVVIVIIVDEGRVKIARTGDPEHPYRAVKNRWPRLMYEPILYRDDRYGTSYGVRVAVADTFGGSSRLIMPFAWGGEKQAGLEFDKTNPQGLLSRLTGGVDWLNREHPVFLKTEDREQAWVRAEHWFWPQLRVGVTAALQHETFAGANDLFPNVGGAVILDTRVDPAVPRNAVYGRASFTHLAGGHQTELDGRGYLGLVGALVFGVRAQWTGVNPELPVYLKPIFGGSANVRGFSPGTMVGDSLRAGSAELLLPLTSPLHLARLGVSAFTDVGAVTCGPELPSCNQSWKHGYGGSIWISATVIRLNVAVAHGVGSSTRVHVNGDISF